MPVSTSRPARDALLADPAGYLTRHEITFRAWPRRRAAVLVAVVAWIAIAIGGMLAIAVFLPGATEVVSIVVALFAMLIASLVSYLIVRSFSRWGAVILSVSGARFQSGAIEVFCPWALFSAPGQPAIQLNSSFSLHPVPVAVVLPVASALVPLMTASKTGSVIAYGTEIKTWHVRFRSPHEIILKCLGGQEEWKDLAPLLLELGRSLGRTRVAGAGAKAAARLPRAEDLGLRCPKCGSRAVSRRGKPSILDGKTGYQCINCGLQMAPLRSRCAIWSLLAIAIALAVATLILFALLLSFAGGPEKRVQEIHLTIHLTLLVWFLFCMSCVIAAIIELRRAVPAKESASLANNPRFRALIEQSRRSYSEQGGIGLEDVRRELGLDGEPPADGSNAQS
jgi:hypothetical protein